MKTVSYSTRMLSISLILLLYSTVAVGQDCGCDHTISPSNSLQVIEASDFDYQPGDTFCFEAGSYDALRLIGFKGTSDNPLTFKNCNGLVDIKATTYTALQFLESEYVHLTGTGSDELEYGIHISESKSGTSGVSVAYLSTDFEIDHLEISNVGFAGIIAKTDPKCDDPNTWRKNYTLRNLLIHDNYIHDTGGEGMYIGATFGYETSTLQEECEDGFAHLLENVKIYDNQLENLGWDGLQVSVAHDGLEVYNNSITNYGTRKEGNQNFGLALGGGCKGKIYNNIILQADEYAIERQRGISMINTISGTTVFNNVIKGAGEYGIWMHIRMSSEAAKDDGYYFFNNTIIEPKGVGILYNNCIPNGGGCRPEMKNAFYNNLVIDPGENFENSGFWKTADEAFIDFITKEVRDGATKADNMFSRDIGSVLFTDIAAFDYSILEGSPAVDAGRDLSEFGVTFDLNNGSRPFGAAFDIGAFEYGATNQVPIANAGENLTAEVGATITLNGEGSLDNDGTISAYSWTLLSGTDEAVTITNADQAVATVTISEAGIYTFRLTVTDNLGAQGTQDVSVEITPISGIIDSRERNSLIENLYPNPTTGPLTMDLYISKRTELDISLFDLNGRVVDAIIDKAIYESGTHSFELDLTKYGAKGSQLILMVRTEDYYDMKKIVIN
jgi:hypothetical protein